MTDDWRGAVAQSRGQRVGRALLCIAVFGVPAFLLAFAVRVGFEPLRSVDDAVIGWATSFTRAWGLVGLLIFIQFIGHPVAVYTAATALTLYAGIVRGMRAKAIWAFSTMMATWIFGEILKVIVQRSRPLIEAPLAYPPGYSFPSGHALNITVAAGVVTLLFWPYRTRTRRTVAVTLAVLVIVVVGLDRVLLGVHYPSDVVAGFVLGLCITFSSWIGFVGPTLDSSSSVSSAPP